ncbi:MAG: tetratricopeptide repeat protein [Candidatus Cryptobacteroides sp.]
MGFYRALTIALIVSASALSVFADDGAGHRADSLIQAFDSQKGQEAARSARLFFDLLEEEGFTDGEIDFPAEGRAGTDAVRALTWYWAGEWYFDRQDYHKSLEYSQKAMKVCKGGGDLLLEADCANILSILHFRKSDYPAALKFAKRTLEIGRELEDISRITSSLNTIAGICLAARQPAEGEKYILEAIRLCEQEKDSVKLAVRCGMAAEIYHGMGQDGKSLEYSTRAYEIDKARGRQDKAAIRLAQMAVAHQATGNPGQAQSCLEEAMPVLKEAGNLQSWAISSNLLGEILLEKGETKEAARCFREALEIFSERHDSYNESRSRLGLSKSLLSSDPAESAKQMHLYSELRDSLYDSEMNMGLNEMHARFQNDRLQAERDSYRTRTKVLVAGFGIFIILASAYILLFRRRQREKIPAPEESTVEPSAVDAPEESLPEKTEESEFMENLEGQIRQEMVSGRVDFEVIASRMCISRAHLNRKVKAATGGTTSDLVNSIRISTAKELLRTTSLPVWEIAEKCGVNDPAYFSTLFKKIVGMSPVQFRNSK